MEQLRPTEQAPSPWSFAKGFGFRFACLYWLLYIFPFPLSDLPFTDWVVGPWNELEEGLLLWFGHQVLGIEGEIATGPTGSGDTTLAFVQLALELALALAGALVWSLARGKRDERRAWAWTAAYVRIYLGVALVSYGSYKVIPSQFPPPSLDRLAQPFGEASPMGLLWTFMGTSTAYQMFTGAGELLAGVLLFQRRTSVLGALLALGVLAQVVALNFCFDVPVKLYSGHLFLMSVFLLLPASADLCGYLARGRGAPPLDVARLFAAARWHHGARVLRSAFLALCLYQRLGMSYQGRRDYALPPPTPFDGFWRVEEFVDRSTDSGSSDPLPDEARWTELVVANSMRLGVTNAGGRYERLQVKLDAAGSSLKLTRRGDPGFQAEFTYELVAPGSMRWNGTLAGHPVRLTLARRPGREYLLVRRGFHWINEVPFNR